MISAVAALLNLDGGRNGTKKRARSAPSAKAAASAKSKAAKITKNLILVLRGLRHTTTQVGDIPPRPSHFLVASPLTADTLPCESQKYSEWYS